MLIFHIIHTEIQATKCKRKGGSEGEREKERKMTLSSKIELLRKSGLRLPFFPPLFFLLSLTRVFL